MSSDWRGEALKEEAITHRKLAAKLSELADDPPFPYSGDEFREEARKHFRRYRFRLEQTDRLTD